MTKFRLAAIVAIAAIMSLIAVSVVSGDAGSQTTDPSDPNRGLEEPPGPPAPAGDDATGTDDRDNGGDGGGALDQNINDDLIVHGSICAGLDCVNGESFGFDTLRLKENNLRIRFQDTSNSASFPTRDWQITINDTTNGGADKFSIDDIDAGRTPFTIRGNAPTHSIFVDASGRVGLKTGTPVVELHIADGDSPTIRLEQTGSSGFTPQTWDMAGNETNFFIRDVTGGSKLPFRIRPGAPSNSLYIDADGDIGLGTQSPDATVDIERSVPSSVRFTNTAVTTCGPADNVACSWDFGITGNGTFKVSEINSGVVEFRFSDEGMMNMKPVASPPTTSVSEGSIYVDDSGAFCVNLNGVWVAAAVQGAGACS